MVLLCSLLVGGIVAAVLLFASRKSPSGAPPSATEGPAPLSPPSGPMRLEEAEAWWRSNYLPDSGRPPRIDAPRLRAAVEEARRRGYETLPGFDWSGKLRELHRRVVESDPFDAASNRALGRVPLSDFPDFWAVFGRLRDAVHLTDALAAIRSRYEDRVTIEPAASRRAPFVEPAEFQEFSAGMKEFLELEKRLREDPAFSALFAARRRIRLDPVLGRHGTVDLHVPPFVLFYGSEDLLRKADTPAETARVEVKRREITHRLEYYRRYLEELRSYLVEQWLRPLGQPDFSPGDTFFVWAFADFETFRRYGALIGRAVTPDLLGYFSHVDHWVYIHEDPARQVTVSQSLGHELAHALHWHLSKSPEGLTKNHFERLEAVWLSEGWADYVGWCSAAGGKFAFGADSVERMHLIHVCRRSGLALMPLKELTQRADYADWLVAAVKHFQRQGVDFSQKDAAEFYDSLPLLLYSQSWLFAKFLNEADGGVHRKRFLTLLKSSFRNFTDLRGAGGFASPHEAFREIFEIRTDADWSRLEQDFVAYVEKMVYRIPPKSR